MKKYFVRFRWFSPVNVDKTGSGQYRVREETRIVELETPEIIHQKFAEEELGWVEILEMNAL